MIVGLIIQILKKSTILFFCQKHCIMYQHKLKKNTYQYLTYSKLRYFLINSIFDEEELIEIKEFDFDDYYKVNKPLTEKCVIGILSLKDIVVTWLFKGVY